MTSAETQAKFASAMQCLRANGLEQAEALLREVVDAEPGRDEAYGGLARVAFLRGRGAEAVEWLKAAVRLRPGSAEHRGNLGMVLSSLGRAQEAIEVFEGLLAVKPDWVEVWNNLGVALKEMKRFEEAERAFRRAVELRPTYADAISNLGVVLQEQGKLDEAIEAFEAAVKLWNGTRGGPGEARGLKSLSNWAMAVLKKGRFVEAERGFRDVLDRDPDNADARFGLGCALHGQNKPGEAMDEYREALNRRPGWAEVHFNLGRAWQDLKDPGQAEAEYRKAMDSKPRSVETANNLGLVLRELDRYQEAEKVLLDATEWDPGVVRTWNNLGGAIADQDRYEEAIVAYQKALAINPTYVDARWNESMALLTSGRLVEGWAGYEMRKKMAKVSHLGTFEQPEWKGEELEGKRILLHAEQGFGDTIQFIRYAPMVAVRGGQVIVQCPRVLHRLIAGKLGIKHLVGGGDAMPEFDVQCSLLSLPRVFGTSLEMVPGREPYLFADEAASQGWRERVAREPGQMKVGLVWAGNPEHGNDKNRSISLAQFAPLSAVKGVTFFSLQKGPEAKQGQGPPTGMSLVNWAGELIDFADTAALIANLDLVISVDTVVVHLAGAMGKPVWVMLPKKADWRWMRGKENSPWYPTARLFWFDGTWERVLERIAAELKGLRIGRHETMLDGRCK